MKKNILIIITIAISAHLNAMEPQTAPCLFYKLNADIMNLIANLLTFDDVETEEEFIERKKSFSDIPAFKNTLRTFTNPEAPTREEFYKKREIPFSWLKKHKNITDELDMNLVVYSSNNNVCAIKYVTYPIPTIEQYNLSIANTTTNQELHNFCLAKNDDSKKKYHYHLAISSSGNIFATIYMKRGKDSFFYPFIKVQNLYTQKKEYPNCPEKKSAKTIAFNKQGTHLIIHYIEWNPIDYTPISQHTIFPLTTTLDDHPIPEKTLPHYFAQKMVCKNLGI